MSEQNQTDTVKTADSKEGVLFYKRKIDHKSNVRSVTDDEDMESAPSMKASSNPPLPELHKDKRKLVIKPFGLVQTKGSGNFVEKEVRQHDNILLKQRNNLLSSENLKLKTRLTVLEKQNQRLQKSIASDTSQIKPTTSYSNNNRERIKAADSTLRAIIRGLRKEIEDLKKDNMNIKTMVKFTSLKELQIERDRLAEETIRLRLSLQEQQSRRTSLKMNAHGVSNLEYKLQSYTEKNAQLNKELREALEKCKKMEQLSSKLQRSIENDKKNTKTLHNALFQLKQKQKEIEQLKSQIKTSNSIPSSHSFQKPKQGRFELRRPSIESSKKKGLSQPSRPAPPSQKQKIGSPSCQKCAKLESENKILTQKLKKIQAQLQNGKGSYGELPKGPIPEVTQKQTEQMIRFMTLRFKAHRLSFQQSQKYLINCEGNMDSAQMEKLISVRQLTQSLLVEPFCIYSNRYIEIMLAKLIYPKASFPINIEQSYQVKKGAIIEAYRSLIPKYEILSQQKEEQMFIQVAQLITTYYQQILAALTAKRNGEGTISEVSFLEFFKEIELEQEYIDFIITQIILESIDMAHLNFFAMFEIFYMPQMNAPPNTKKKFQVEHQQIVQQEDEELEESKSHMGSRKRTLEHREPDDKEQMDEKEKEGLQENGDMQERQENEEYEWQQEQGNKKDNKVEEKGYSDEKVNRETKPQTGHQEEEEEEIYEDEFQQRQALPS